ncbi:hypothetical protein [Candidatus Izimaplasma sp. ZiA1]|uniref:hypothetical protein n=1 Tax=Candidatus Izimoplasma sp. ZiA1 TaxID=2024899 RepID=UPI0014391DFA
MPKSKKRVKKNHEEVIPVTKNPLRTKWGKVMVLVLALGFVLGSVAGLIYTLYLALQA